MGLAEQFLQDAGSGKASAPSSLSAQFAADAGANPPAPGQARTEPYFADMDKARGDASFVGSNVKNMLYGGAKSLADNVQGYGQAIINGAAALSGDGPAGRYVKDKAAQFNHYLHDQEAQYQADTAGSGAAGIGRVAGGVAPFLATGGAGPAADIPLWLQMAKAGGKGALYGANQPVNDVQTAPDGSNDFFRRKGVQAAVAGGVSAGSVPIGNAVARVVSPNTAPEVKALMQEGITPTPGQILGKGWSAFEDKMTSVPIVGDMIKNSQRRAIDDMNRAAYNRALAPIGEKSTAPVGRDGIAEVKSKLGTAYDNLLPKLAFRADQQFAGDIGNLSSAIQNGNVPPAIASQFNSILKNEVFSRMTPQGTMNGQSFKDLETALTLKIKQFGSSQDPNHQAIAGALREVQDAARSALNRSNPHYAAELQAINEGYANYARIRAAGSSLGANEGVFTPAQLQNAVKAGDKSVGKGQFATGGALMQDLAEPAKSVLGAAYPNSGTPGRAMVAGIPAAMGAAYLYPMQAAAMGVGGTAAMAPYTPIGQQLAAALLAKRPAMAGPVAGAVRSGAPALGAVLAPFLAPAIPQ